MANNKPDFTLIANGTDITGTIIDNFLGLTLTDASEFESDMLEITIRGDGVRKPPKGAELELWLGYTGDLTKMGLFVVDEVPISGPPTIMTIRARGTPFEASKGGMSGLQSQKTRVWERGTVIDDVVSKIANEHNLEPLVSRSLQGIVLPQFDQTAESDISFLLRVGRKYDGIVKPGGGKIVLFRRGDFNLPLMPVTAVEEIHWEYNETSRDTSGTVVAFWHDKKTARRQEVEVGSGDPVKQLRQWYPTEDAAKAAATAELNRRKRGASTFSVSMPGNAKMSTDCRLAPQGFHPDIPALFIVTGVTHRLDKNGYVCDVTSELPLD